MAHHAYFVAGDIDTGVTKALAYVGSELGLTGTDNSNIVSLHFGLFSVDDSRRLITSANLSATRGKKAIIASMTRIFHEAQNSLLKILEEPPEGVTIILCVPSEGVFIPTLRSRLLGLPVDSDSIHAKSMDKKEENTVGGIAQQFLASTPTEREKLAAQLVDRTKSDKEEIKQGARQEAIDLISGLTKSAHSRLEASENMTERKGLVLFLEELTSFTPILYERSAPLKLILEHILLVIPQTLTKAKV